MDVIFGGAAFCDALCNTTKGKDVWGAECKAEKMRVLTLFFVSNCIFNQICKTAHDKLHIYLNMQNGVVKMHVYPHMQNDT